MPRFECQDGVHRKFWEIGQNGHSLTVRWGRSGLSPHERRLGFRNEAEARSELERQIARQQALGYVEVMDVKLAIAGIDSDRWFRRLETAERFVELVLDRKSVQERRGSLTPDPAVRDTLKVAEHPSPADARDAVAAMIKGLASDGYLMAREGPAPASQDVRVAHEPALEAQCRASPDDPAPWEVYADWLMANGDARGELAALRLHHQEREAELFYQAHQWGWLGELVSTVRITGWRHGFARAAGIRVEDDGPFLADVTARLLALPFARFIDSLRFGLAGSASNNDWGPTLAAIAAAPQAAAIRELRFDDYEAHESEISWVAFGDFSSAWARLSALEVLTIRSGAGGTLGTIALPRLTTFVRESGGLSAAELASIDNATWPALQHLEIWFGSSRYGAEGTVDSIRRILAGKGLPALVHLGLVNSELVDELIPALASSKILPQLRTLDLSNGVMTDVAATLLVRNAAAFAHLTAIDVTGNLLREAELARLRAALPRIVSRQQRDRDDEDDDSDEPAFRYVALSE